MWLWRAMFVGTVAKLKLLVFCSVAAETSISLHYSSQLTGKYREPSISVYVMDACRMLWCYTASHCVSSFRLQDKVCHFSSTLQLVVLWSLQYTHFWPINLSLNNGYVLCEWEDIWFCWKVQLMRTMQKMVIKRLSGDCDCAVLQLLPFSQLLTVELLRWSWCVTGLTACDLLKILSNEK